MSAAEEFTEENDRIPDETLVKLAAFYEAMPTSWEVKSTQARPKSVTVTIAFDGVTGWPGQVEAFERLTMAASFLGTLVRNLQRERDRTKQLTDGAS